MIRNYAREYYFKVLLFKEICLWNKHCIWLIKDAASNIKSKNKEIFTYLFKTQYFVKFKNGETTVCSESVHVLFNTVSV